MGLIGTVGNIDKITVGGVELVDIANLFCVGCTVNAVGLGARYSTARSQFATSGYQVGVGKSFRVLAVRMTVLDATAGSGSSDSWGYGDTDVGSNSAAAPTTPIVSNVMRPGPGRVANSTTYIVTGRAEVPASKYVYAQNDGASAYWNFYGYEV